MPLEILMGASAVSNIVGGLSGSGAAKDAASIQAGAADRTSANTMSMFNTQQQNLKPFMTGGVAANNKLLELLGLSGPGVGATPSLVGTGSGGGTSFNPSLINDPEYNTAWQSIFGGPGQGDSRTWSPQDLEAALKAKLSPEYMAKLGGGTPGAAPGADFGMLTKTFSPDDFLANKDPSYEWIKSQSEDALLNKASAMGGVGGGNTMKAMVDYITGAASSEYGNSFNRWNTMMNQLFSRLSGVSGTGANAAGGIAGLGANATASANDAALSGAAATAAGRVGSANALSAGFAGAGNNAMLYSLLNQGKTQAPTTFSADPNFAGDAAASLTMSG